MYRSAEGIPHAQYCNNVSFISLSCIYYVVNLYPVSSSKMYLNIVCIIYFTWLSVDPHLCAAILKLAQQRRGKNPSKMCFKKLAMLRS